MTLDLYPSAAPVAAESPGTDSAVTGDAGTAALAQALLQLDARDHVTAFDLAAAADVEHRLLALGYVIAPRAVRIRGDAA